MKPTLPNCLHRQMTTRLVLFTLALLGFGLHSGQAQELYHYTNDITGNYGPGTLGAHVSASSTALTRGDDVFASTPPCGAAQGHGSDGWPATNVFDVEDFNDNGDYVSFTVIPVGGYGLKVTGFSARLRRENQTGTVADGPISVRYGYSTNGLDWTTVNPGAPQISNVCSSGGVLRVWPGWTEKLVYGPITFRIYGLSSGTGDLYLHDVIVNGEACANNPAISLDWMSSDLTLCKGETGASLAYSALDASSYSINFDGDLNALAQGFTTQMGPLSSAPGAISINVPATAAAGTYSGTLRVLNGCGFYTDYSFQITVNALPTAALSGDQTICAGDFAALDVSFTGAGPWSLKLSDGTTYNNVAGNTLGGLSPGSTTTYTIVALTDGNGCSALPVGLTGSAEVTVKPAPEASISVSDAEICAGESITLTFHESNYPDGTSFTITALATDDNGGPNPIVITDVVNNAVLPLTEGIDFTGDLTVSNIVVSHDDSGCDVTLLDNIEIAVDPLPDAYAENKSVCHNGNTDLEVTNPNNVSGSTFTWTATYELGIEGGDFSGSGNFGLSAINENLMNSTLLPAVATYTITPVGPAPTNCAGEQIVIEVVVLPNPQFGFTAFSESDAGGSGNNVVGPSSIQVDLCAGDHLTLKDYTDNGNVGYLGFYTTTGNTTYDGSGLPLGPVNFTIAPSGASAFFGEVSPVVYGGALGYGLSSSSAGQIVQVFTPYLDVNGNDAFDLGIDCLGGDFTLIYEIHAIPTVNVNPLTNAVCAGAELSYDFTGNYTDEEVTYTWTNDNTAIGLGDSGTGDIPLFTGTNTTGAPITATVTVTPSTAHCSGTPVMFTITVYPAPTVSVTANGLDVSNTGNPNSIVIELCSGQSFSYTNYLGTANTGFLDDITDGSDNLLYGVSPIPTPRPTANIAAGDAATFFAGTYGPYNLASGTYGWLTEVFTPYFDANNSGMYESESDCLGDPFSITYHIYAPIQVTVTRNNSGQICSGDLVDYSITTPSTEDILVDITLEPNPNPNNQADLTDDNTFLPTQTITISSSAPGAFSQAIANVLGTFDRGRVSFRVENARYANTQISCGATITNTQQNTQVYPKPILTDPADIQVESGDFAIFNFDPLLNGASIQSSTAGYPIRIQWTAVPSVGVTVAGQQSGTDLVIDENGIPSLADDISKKVKLDPGVCYGTVTFHITPESDGPNPGGGFDGNFCPGDGFDVVVYVVKPLTLTASTEDSPVGCGDLIKVKVIAENFCDLTGLSLSVNWDETKFVFDHTELPPAPSPFADGAEAFQSSPNTIDFQWFGDASSIADGETVFCYYLKAIASTGSDLLGISNVLNSNSHGGSVPVLLNGNPLQIEIEPLSLVLVQHDPICPNDASITLQYNGVVGNPTDYLITFVSGPEVLDGDGGTLVPDPMGSGIIIMGLPGGLTHGTYTFTLVISNDQTLCSSEPITFTIVVDETAPTAVIDPLALSLYSCEDDVPLQNTNVVVDEDDDCTDSEDLLVTFVSEVKTGGGCCSDPLIITRTYRVTDEAGNSTNVIQTITVKDCEEPEIDGAFALKPCYADEDAIEADINARIGTYLSDNCSTPSVFLVSIVPAVSDCGYDVTIIVKDACDLGVSGVYHTVIDNTDPVLTQGELADCYETEADAVADAILLTSADELCSDVEFSTEVEEDLDHDCHYIITVTATDACGHEASTTYPAVKIDGTSPVILEPNVQQTSPDTYTSNAMEGRCFQTDLEAFAAAELLVVAADDCSQPDVLIFSSDLVYLDDQDCEATIVVSITDECGNATFLEFPGVRIDDVDPVITEELPLVTCFKTSEEAETYMEIFVRSIVKDCTPSDDLNAVEATYAPPVVPSACESGTITVSVEDCAGNITISEPYDVLIDDTDPIFPELPALEVLCLTNIPPATDYYDEILDLVEDACSDVEIEVLEDVAPTGCGVDLQGHRTYQVTDCAGNKAVQTQVVILNDTEAPIWDDETLTSTTACNCGPGCPEILYFTPAFTDNSCSEIVPTFTESEETVGCTRTITRIWTAEDDCGNISEEYTQIFQVVDHEAPSFDPNGQLMPANLFTTGNNADCSLGISLVEGQLINNQTDWTVAGILIAPLGDFIFDNCTPASEIVVKVAEITDENIPTLVVINNDLEEVTVNCVRQITVSFQLYDGCDNTDPNNLFTCVYNIIDDTAPSLTPAAGAYDITLQCSDQAGINTFQGLDPVALDNCDQELDIEEVHGDFVAGACPQTGTYTNTWTATDCAGNVSTFTQVIHIQDTKAPVWVNAAGNLNRSVACGDAAALIDAQALVPTTSDCDAEPTLTKTPGVFVPNPNCPSTGTYTNTWIATDHCNNTSTTYTQVISIIDQTAPVLSMGSIATCYQTQAAAEAAAIAATGVSDCSNVSKTAVTTGTCNASIVVTVTDCALNASSTIAYLTRIDNSGPVLTEGPIVHCFIDIPTAEAAAKAATTATDNCSGPVTKVASTSGTCPAIITVTVTDGCGNSSFVKYGEPNDNYEICIGPSTILTITPASAPATIACENIGTLQAGPLATWLNNHGNATVTSGTGVEWTYSPADPLAALAMTAPNCMTFTKTVVVTFTATDDCGHTAVTSASFTVVDNTPPTVSNLPTLDLIGCGTGIVPAAPGFTPDPNDDPSILTGPPTGMNPSDNCDNALTIRLVFEGITGAGCPANPYLVTRTYTATDDYCRVSTATQMITVKDNVAPTFTIPANITVEGCSSAVSTGVSGDVTNEVDNCTASGPGLQAVYTDVVTAGTPGQNPKFTINRTWTLTDACGNAGVTKVQVITVRDNTAPTLSACPANTVLPSVIVSGVCGANAGSIVPPTAGDNCAGVSMAYSLSGATTGTGSSTITQFLLDGVTTVTYTATDAVGSTLSCSFTVTVNCVTVAGHIIWEQDHSKGVNNTTVNLTPTAPLVSDLSDIFGEYILPVPANGNYTITPVKNNGGQVGRLNGVNADDATAIQNHLNMSAPIVDPYKKVCADVNRSNVITNVDAQLITQAIAGNEVALMIFNQFWRFVPTPPTFVWPVPNPAFPNNIPPFPTTIAITTTGVDLIGRDFYGMKIGDVVATWADPSILPNLAPLVWMVEDQTLEAGQDIVLNFNASNFNDFSAYQFALDFDPAQLQFKGFGVMGALPMNLTDNFGAYNADLGQLRHVWSAAQGNTLADGTPVFQVRFKVLASGKQLSEVLRLDDSEIDCKAFSHHIPADVKLVFTTSVDTHTPLDPNQLSLQLMQNRPNPFSDATTIGFILPEACAAHIRILDISGRELANYDREYTAGYHELDFRMENAFSYGVLFCELVTPQGRKTIKMMTAK